MGIFSNLFGGGGASASAKTGNKTMVVIDWDRVESHIANLKFLEGKHKPEIHIYTRKGGGVLLKDLSSRYKTIVHQVPKDERNFSNFMSCSVIYEFAKDGGYNKILFVFEGQGLSSTRGFLESKGVKIENVSLGNGEERRGRDRNRNDRDGSSREGRQRPEGAEGQQPRAERTGDRRNERKDRPERPERREPRAEGGREGRQRPEGAEGQQPRAERTADRRDRNRDRNNRGERREQPARYTPTDEDATRMAARMRENFNLFKDYSSDQLTLVVKQATDHSSQDIFGTKSPKVIVRALVEVGYAEMPEERKFRLTNYPDEQFYQKLFARKVGNGPDPKPQPKPALADEADEDDSYEPQAEAQDA